ncbi:soluble quinoprotein glucose/sorbosone dehydrogenase [Paramyrothecium foliicola]|nr:soluble quinoprotein glucose/sorbosone dehydrogenase [Paramyrothecium foliicola]
MSASRMLLGALLALAARNVAAQCEAIQPLSNPATAPEVGYKVLSNGLRNPRSLVQDTNGNLLVLEQSTGVRRIVLKDSEGLNVCVESSAQLISDEKFNHGLALSQDGKTLLASTAVEVHAFPYDASQGSIGTGKVIITGMTPTGTHRTRTLLAPPNDPNLLLVSHGSIDNMDEDALEVESGRSSIRVFKLGDLLDQESPVNFTDGAVLGWGLRNSEGVGQDPSTGNIWSVENSLDNMKRSGKDIHNDNPGEELNLHGRPGDTEGELYGKNFGYPSCVAIWNPDTVEDYPGGATVGKHMAGDQSAPQHDDEYCQNETIAPKLTFAAHTAPLDIKFQQNGAAAFISLHGSWNRSPPNGYRVSRVAFSDGMPTAPPDSRDAEVPLLWNSETAKCPGECFRPVGLLLDGRGRLFMTSDKTGELFVLTGVEVHLLPLSLLVTSTSHDVRSVQSSCPACFAPPSGRVVALVTSTIPSAVRFPSPGLGRGGQFKELAMPALLHLTRPEAFTQHLPSIIPRAATAAKLLLAPRQGRDGDEDDEPYTVVPAQYGSLHNSPSPGVVAGIVLASVAGFLLILAVIYTCLNGIPVGLGVNASDGVSTYVSRADNRSRRRSAAAAARQRSRSRSTSMYEVRTRTTTTRERVVPVAVASPTASTAFEPRRDPSAHRGSRPPPPRVVPRDDESSGSEDEVVVIEEHSPPRRKSRRVSPSYFSDDRSRRDSSYRDAESDLYSHSRR